MAGRLRSLVNTVGWEVARGARATGATAINEAKNLGKFASTQTGIANLHSSLGVRSVSKQELPQSHLTGSPSTFGELRKFGHTAARQTGIRQPHLSPTGMASMTSPNDATSEAEAEQIKKKIHAIYEEYEQKRKAKVAQQRQMAATQVEQRKARNFEIEQVKKRENVNPAIAKTRAENKNYGAE